LAKSIVEPATEVVLDLTEKTPIQVLHVDDEPGLLKALKQILEMQGPFQVETASSVEEAMERMKKKAFDVIVSDYVMPREDGLQFLKELREKDSRIPFIIFTGKGREEVAIKALNLGADQYLNKGGRPEAVYGELAHSIRTTVKAKQAEEALRESEEKYRSIVELAPDSIMTFDLKGVITSCNTAATRLSGYSKDELVGKHFSKIGPIRARDIPKFLKMLPSTLRGKVPKPFEITFQRKDGTTRRGEVHISLMRVGGKTIGLQAIMRDISERKETVERLRASEEKYRGLFENARDVTLTMDLKGKITSINKAAVEYGFKKDEIIGKSQLKFVPKKYWPRLLKELVQIARGKTVEGEVEINTPKGKKVADYRSAPIITDDKVVGVQTILRDITEYRMAEEKFRSVFASSPDAITVIDLNGNIIECNQATLGMLGFSSKDEVIGKSGFALVAEEDRERVKENLKKLLEEGSMKNAEYTALTKDGREILAEISSSVVRDSSGNPLGFVGITKDIIERKKIEKALRESEEKYKELTESIDDIFFAMDKDLRYIYWNKASEKLTGISAKDAIGKYLTEIFPDVKGTKVEQFYLDTLRTRQPRTFMNEYQIGDKNFVFEINAYPTQGGLSVFVKDLTEHKKMLEELRSSEKRLNILFEFAPDAYYLNDLKGNFVDGNKAAEELTGYNKSELVGKSFLKLKLLPRRQIPKAAKLLAKNALGKPTGPDEFVLNRKDGTQVPVEIRTFPVKIKDQTLVLGIARDITERKKAEKAIGESQQKFERLFMGNPEAAVHLNTDFYILDINPRFIKLFGYSLDKIKSKHIDDLVVPKDKIEEAKMLDEKARKGYVYHDTVRKRKDGSLVSVSISAAPITVEDTLTGYVAVYKDISQLKRTEKQLKETLEKVETMNEKLGVVGKLARHDARNKLSTVTMNTFLAKQKLADHPEVLEYLSEIESAVQQTERIFDFARIYEKLGMEELVYMDVEKSLKEAAMLFSDLRNVKVLNDCHGLTVLADSLLRQILYNLVDNSLKHGERVSRIRLHCKEISKDQLKLVYEDDGIGIPKAEKEKIFKEGYGKGTGYGLYLIKKMCEVYGWTIQETGKQGKGAQFTMTIPKMGENGKINYKLH